MMTETRIGTLLIAWMVAASPTTAQQDVPAIVPAPSGTIDVRARETRLVDILQQLADATGRNIVVSPNAADLRVTVTLRSLTEMEVLDAILPSVGCDYRDRGKFLFVNTLENLQVQETTQDPLAVRVVKLKYTRATDVVEMITPFLGPNGQIVASPESATGIEANESSGDAAAGGDVLILEDTPARLTELMNIIHEIDVRPQQVLVEATILRATLDDDNQLGIDFNFLGGVDFESAGVTSTAGIDLTSGQIPTSEFEKGIASVNTGFSTAIGDEGFTFGLIKNNIAIFIRALEELTDTTVLANPKVLALNKQRGEVIIGRRDGYVTTTVTETAAVQAVEFLETGTQLNFRPFVVDDNRVRMEIHVEDSAGGLNPSDLPFETTTESTTNILVEDGHTIVIGGLFRGRTDVSRSQIPGLGEIPGFGALFRRSQDQDRREEVIVLLTVHIIKDEKQFADASLGLLDDTVSIRKGMRNRLQWHGRLKLADAHIASAIEKINEQRPDAALFHTRLALFANPLHPVGQRLQRQLVERRDTIEPNNEIRQWVARQLIKQPTVDEATRQPIRMPTSNIEQNPSGPSP